MATCDLHLGDALEVLKTLPSESVNCCVTSPPYWGLRNYEINGQMGIEETPEKYTENLVRVFAEVKRVLKNDGTLWIVIGDSYAAAAKNRTPEQSTRKSTLHGGLGRQRQVLKQQNKIVSGLKPKDIVGIPWLVALGLRSDGWYLRIPVVWSKPNGIPFSGGDRPTLSHEYVLFLTKSPTYEYDAEAIKEPASEATIKRLRQNVKAQKGSTRANAGGKSNGPMKAVGSLMVNKRSVWTVPTKPSNLEHYAAYPEELITPCVLAGCPKGGTILDPFFGTGTTGVVALRHGCNFIGIELNPKYLELARKRIEPERAQQKLFI